MKITLKNIGKIDEAQVEINGITVIAGENDTGKSTVGKALYGVFNGLYNVENKIRSEIEEKFEDIMKNLGNTYYPMEFWFDEEKFSFKNENFEFIKDSSKKILEEYISHLNSSFEFTKEKLLKYLHSQQYQIEDEVIQYLFEQLGKLFSVSKSKIVNHIVESDLNAEFNNKISNIFKSDTSEIVVNIRKVDTIVKIRDDEVEDVINPVVLKIPIWYIDNPLVLDNLRRVRLFRTKRPKNHNDFLKEKLFVSQQLGGVINEILAKESLKNIYEKINSACDGKLVHDFSGVFEYEFKETNKKIPIENLSTGLKSFVILKTLLYNGDLRENATIIFDEPEVHLHPRWQLLFAEIIVLLHKEFKIHVLLNTHSPYFLEAIEVYASKYEIADKCKYYLSQEREDCFYIEDVTHCVDEIYKKLAYPFQILEDERYSDE